MKDLRLALFLPVLCSVLQAGDIVEVTATLIPVQHPDASQLTQIELHQQTQIARSRGSQDLLKLSAVVESGKWATIKRGREFFYPESYSDAKVHQSASDDGKYSVAKAETPPGNRSLVLPNFPVQITKTELGASLRVRPTVKEDGLIYLEGQFNDTVFEGLSDEAIPIKVETRQMIGQNKVHEILSSRIDRAIFRRVEKEFAVMLPHSAGTSLNAKRLRQAKQKYTYFLPVELGNTAFGAPGKIELKSEQAPSGPIRSTLMKATMVKDFFIKKQPDTVKIEHGILILEVKKIKQPDPIASTRGNIEISTAILESKRPPDIEKPVLTTSEFEATVRSMNLQQGTDLVSTPKMLLRPNSPGTIEIARELVFPSQYAPPTIDSESIRQGLPLIPARPTDSESRKVGISLQMSAAVESGNFVRLKVTSSITAFEGFLDFGNPVMAVKAGMIKKMKPTVADPNKVELPVFPFRQTETELLVPNGSHVAMTMIFDYHNENHQKDRFLRLGKAKVAEIETPRYLTIFVSPAVVAP